MLTGRTIVCLSTQDWDGLWTRKQRFMKMLAAGGNRVLYIETAVHMLGLDVLPQDWGRWLRFTRGPRQVDTDLYVATLPVLLPFFQMFGWINTLNHIVISRLLKRWIGKLNFGKPLLWIYTPYSAPVVDAIPHTGVIYECVDEFRAARGLVRSSVIAEMEKALLRRVDLTFVTQENLLEYRKAFCERVFCIPNGADTALFRRAAEGLFEVPSDLERLPGPKLGFVGHIHYWIDLDLIQYLAERKPSWTIVLIGPQGPLAKHHRLHRLSNVHFLGKRPMQEIPALLQGLDCCLNPYVTGHLSDAASPLKLFEYVSAGKPVVSTVMSEARKFHPWVRCANTYEEFVALCESVIASLPETPDLILKRTLAATEHSWENRFRQVNELIETYEAEGSSVATEPN